MLPDEISEDQAFFGRWDWSLLATAKFGVVAADEVLVFWRDWIAINRDGGVFCILAGQFFDDAIPQFHERAGDAGFEMIDLRGSIVSVGFDPHRACIVQDPGGIVAEFGLLEQFFDGAEAVCPTVVALSCDRCGRRLLSGGIEEKATGLIATARAIIAAGASTSTVG